MRKVLVLTSALGSSFALAAAPAYANVSQLTEAINVDELKTTLYTVGALMIGVAVAIMIIRRVRASVK